MFDEARKIGNSWHLSKVIKRRLKFPCLSLLDPMAAPLTAFACSGLLIHRNVFWLWFVIGSSILNWQAFRVAAYGLSWKSHREWNEALLATSAENVAIERIFNLAGDPDQAWGRFNSFSYDIPEPNPDPKAKTKIEREIVIFAPTPEGPVLESAKSYPSTFGINVIILDTSLLEYDKGPNFTLYHEIGHVSNAGVLASIYGFHEASFFIYVISCTALASSTWWTIPIFVWLALDRSFFHMFATSKALPEIAADIHAVWHLPVRYVRECAQAIVGNWTSKMSAYKEFDVEWRALNLRRTVLLNYARAREQRVDFDNDPRKRSGFASFGVPVCMALLAILTVPTPRYASWMLAMLICFAYIVTQVHADNFHKEHQRGESTFAPYTLAFDRWQQGPQRAHLVEAGMMAAQLRQQSDREVWIKWLVMLSESPYRTQFETHLLDELYEDGQMPEEVSWPKS